MPGLSCGTRDLCCSTRDLRCGVGDLFSCGMQTLSCGLWDLVSWPGIEPGPPALGPQGLSHWTTREVPTRMFLITFRTQDFSNNLQNSVLFQSGRIPFLWQLKFIFCSSLIRLAHAAENNIWTTKHNYIYPL